MRRSLAFVLLGVCAAAGALLFPSPSHAEPLGWGDDPSWAVEPGPHVPYNGMPYVERYGYGPSPPIFLRGNYARQFWSMYEIDRQQRLEAFGERYGPDHPPLFNRLLHRPHW